MENSTNGTATQMHAVRDHKKITMLHVGTALRRLSDIIWSYCEIQPRVLYLNQTPRQSNLVIAFRPLPRLIQQEIILK